MVDWFRKPDQVYFLRPKGMVGPIRIGASCEPQKRLQSYNTCSPFPLELLLTIPGGWPLETNIHQVFASAHSHGEWFFATSELLKAIAEMQSGVPVEVAIDLTARFGSIRKTKRVFRTAADPAQPAPEPAREVA